MPTERELAISPIVQESVQHNTQVHPHHTHISHNPLSKPLTISLTGNLQHPLPHRLPLRRRLRDPRSRVLRRFPLLPPRHILRLGAHLEHTGKGQARGLLPGSLERAVGRGCTERRDELCADVDAVLWVGEGLMEL